MFYRNGTIKGRVRVTDDPGGVLGLLRGQGQTVLFWSSHSFGFFSVAQIDVQYPPCTGWNSPLYDIAVDPSLSYSRVVLALADGNVVVFATTRGKSKACDLTLKFPHVSTLPFRLHAIKGHILGMPVPAEEEDMKADHLREFFFFNLAAMEAGYGATPSRAVPIQISFKPQQPTAYALHTPNAGSGSGATAERTKAQVAICFEDQRGLELYEVNLKQPVPPKGTAVVEDGGLGRSDSSDGYGWLNWFPKIGVFGIALIGVVIWNVRKVTAQRRHDRRDDFDEEFLKERLRERKLKKPQDDTSASRIGGLGAGSASSGIGGGASSSSGGASVRDD